MEKQKCRQLITELQSRDGDGYLDEVAYAAARETLNIPAIEWPPEIVQAFISALNEDNGGEIILDELLTCPEQLLFISPIVIRSENSDAKWQIASALGRLPQKFTKNIEHLLISLLDDKDEYVRRRALLALGELRSSVSEKYALLAWDSGLEYQCMVAQVLILRDCIHRMR